MNITDAEAQTILAALKLWMGYWGEILDSNQGRYIKNEVTTVVKKLEEGLNENQRVVRNDRRVRRAPS